MSKEPAVNISRLDEQMEKKRWGPGDLATYSGVSYDTIYKIRVATRPRTSAEILGKLVQALGTSVDYILGLTDDPTPASRKELPEDLRELWEVYEELPRHRQRDVLKIAMAFSEEDERAELSRQIDEQIKQRLDAAEQAGGEVASELLADLVPRLSAMIMDRIAAGRSVVSGGVESKRVDEKLQDT